MDDLTEVVKQNAKFAEEADETAVQWIIGVILGLCRDNGKENANYYNILGLYRGLRFLHV